MNRTRPLQRHARPTAAEERRNPAEIAALALLQRARDAGGGGLRRFYLDRAQQEIAKLDPTRDGQRISQLESRALALQGRGGDTEIAHLSRGELVVPMPLQNPEVIAALQRAAARYGVPLGMLSVGNAMNRINPTTGTAEFDVLNWVSGLFGDQSQSSAEDSDDHVGQAATEGAMARAAQTGINTANVRADYADQVGALDPTDTAGRSAAKAQARAALPPETLAITEKARQGLGPREGSVGRANISNAAWDQAARRIGMAAKGLAGVDAVMAAHDIATSDNPVRAAVANAGAIGGGMLGGFGGGALGAMAGPGAFVTAPAGAVVGSSVGGAAGYKAGEGLYDYAHDLWNKRF